MIATAAGEKDKTELFAWHSLRPLVYNNINKPLKEHSYRPCIG